MQTDSGTSSNTASGLLFEQDNIQAFQDIILELVFKEIKVYLDGLGILFSEHCSDQISYFCNDKVICRNEDRLEICFEKSYELTGFHYDKFPKIMDSRELALRTLPRLKIAAGIKYNIKDLEQDIKRLINDLRTELLCHGHSSILDKIGTFYALKINHELNWRDKFSNADICLVANSAKIVSSEEVYSYQAPVLKDACEPLQSFYPDEAREVKLNLKNQAEMLGIESEKSYINEDIAVKTFLAENPNKSDEEIAIFCTSGIHPLAHQVDPKSIGVELVVQANILKGENIPEWPVNLITVFWMMILSSKRKAITPCSLVNIDLDNLIPEQHSLSGLFTTNFALLPSTYQSLSGQFRYINILGLIEDEVKFATKHGTSKLLDVLTTKDFHQAFKLNRRNIFS